MESFVQLRWTTLPSKTLTLDEAEKNAISIVNLSPKKLQQILGKTLVPSEISILHGRERSLLTLLSHFICTNIGISGQNALYLDSGRNFSPLTIKKMLASISKKESAEILSKISVGKVYALEDIEVISSQIDSANMPSLIVLDNLTALLNLSTTPGKKGRQRRLFAALEEIRRLVNRSDAHVLMTDHSTADWQSGSFKPLGGNVVTHAVDSLSLVTKLDTEDIVNIKVERSPHVNAPAGLLVRLNHCGAFALEG
jgi:RecA/RadA recombinase